MYIGQQPVVGRYIKVDQISGGFNGTASGFTLAAGGQGVLPGTARNLMLSLGGVIQEPETDFTVSGSGITFTTPPVSGTTFFCVVFGDMQAVGTPSDGTVLPASISTSGTFVFPNVTVSGTTVIASGTAAAPSLAVSGDLNTGLYSPGADQLAISTGGSQRLNIDANGRLNVAANSQGIRFGTQANISAAEGAELILNNLGAQPIAFYTNNSERLRITSTGLVGVGTSSPNYRLDIAGSANSTAIGTTLAYGTSAEVYSAFRFNNSSFSGGSSEIRNIANGSSHLGSTLAFFTSQTGTGTLTQRLAIDFLGRVGIGTSSPAAELDVQGGANIGDATSTVRITADGTNGYIGTSTNHPLRIRTNNLSAITIDTSQRVGIGTSSPATALHVSGSGTQRIRITGTGAANAILSLDAPSTYANYIEYGLTASTPLRFYDVAATADRMIIDTSGRVGIGTTSPNANWIQTNQGTATISAGIDFKNSAGTSSGQIGLSAAGSGTATSDLYINGANNVDFYIGGLTRARIDSSGRLLVGTSTARANFFNSAVAAALQVEGTTASTANLSVVANRGGSAALLTLAASGGSTIGSNTIVANNFALGGVEFCGSDGTEFVQAAEILCEVDGTPGANDMPGRLMFSTTADGASSPTERMRITNAGNVGIGTTSPGTYGKFAVRGAAATGSYGNVSGHFSDASTGSFFIGHASNTLKLFTDTSNLTFGFSNSEAARIDSSGRLLVGTSSSPSAGGGQYSLLTVQGYVGAPTGAAFFSLQRGETAANITTDEALGLISFNDSAGNQFAEIVGRADGNGGANDYPGRLEFGTTADGASSPTERLRISQNGNVLFSNVANSVKPAADNAVAMGASGGRWSEIWAANGTIQTSDERAKTEITDATLGADFIKALRPVSYKWVEGGQRHTGEYDEDGNFVYESVPGNRRHWGFIAQEVKEATDAAGVDFGGWVLTDKDDPDSQQALRYDQFIAPLTKALQEALAEIDVLKAKVAALEAA